MPKATTTRLESAAPKRSTLRALVAEVDGDPVEVLPVYGDSLLTEPAYTVPVTPMVEPWESKVETDPDTGGRLPVYRIRHGEREGWIPQDFLKR